MEEISYAGSKNKSKKRLSKRLLIFGGLFILVLVLLGSAIYFITTDSKSTDVSDDTETTNDISLPPDEEITETPEPTKELSVTPEKSVAPSKSPSKTPSKSPVETSSKSDLKVVVQNGSGVSGAAASAAEVLKTAGYTISSTGNADTTDYTDVTIKIKASEKSNLSDIEKALSKEYSVGDTSTDLSESSSYDVLVIVGK